MMRGSRRTRCERTRKGIEGGKTEKGMKRGLKEGRHGRKRGKKEGRERKESGYIKGVNSARVSFVV